MTNFKDFLKEQLSDPEVKAEYDALEPEFSIMQAMIDARKAAGLTQKQTSVSWKAETPTPLCAPCSGWLPVWECR